MSNSGRGRRSQGQGGDGGGRGDRRDQRGKQQQGGGRGEDPRDQRGTQQQGGGRGEGPRDPRGKQQQGGIGGGRGGGPPVQSRDVASTRQDSKRVGSERVTQTVQPPTAPSGAQRLSWADMMRKGSANTTPGSGTPHSFSEQPSREPTPSSSAPLTPRVSLGARGSSSFEDMMRKGSARTTPASGTQNSVSEQPLQESTPSSSAPLTPRNYIGAPGSSSTTVHFQFGSMDQDYQNPSNVSSNPESSQPSTSRALNNETDSWTKFVKILCQNVFRVIRDNDPEDAQQFKLISDDLKRYVTLLGGREAIFPARPIKIKGQNSNKQTVSVSTNHFKITLPNLSEIPHSDLATTRAGTRENAQIQFHLYSVTWYKASQHCKLEKDSNLKFWAEMLKRHGSNPNGMNSVRPVYDGGSMMVSHTPFAWEEKEIKYGVNLENDDIKVVITFIEILDWESCQKFLRLGTNDETNNDERNVFPKDAIKILNMVMKEYCLRKGYFESGRFYFDKARSNNLDGELLNCNSGYFQSVRALQGGMTLNVDVMNTAFYKPDLPLSNVWDNIQRNYLPEAKKRSFRDWTLNSEWNLEQVGIANDYWKNLRIVSSHRKQLRNDDSNPKTFSVYQLEKNSALNTQVTGLYGQYFEGNLCLFMNTKYRLQIDLLGKMPAIKVSKNEDHYLPWGCCQTTGESRFAGKIESTKTLTLLERNPKERCEDIVEWIEKRYGLEKPDLTEGERSFRIIVDTNMMVIDALQLPKPTMEARDNQKLVWFGDEPRNPRPNPSFNFKTQKFMSVGPVCPWGVISFDQHSRRWQDHCITKLLQKATDLGIVWPQQQSTFFVYFPAIPVGSSNEERIKLVKDFITRLMQRHGQLKLIICFMARKMTPEYGALKAQCDIVHGVPLQVVLKRDVPKDAAGESRMNMLALNLLLKINVKSGGINFRVSPGNRQQQAPSNAGCLNEISLMREDENNRTILLGADVTHPRGMRSIAAVVATTDRHFMKYATRIHLQESGMETIHNLKASVMELLTVYYQNEQTWPRRIVFFRDGVSESKFLDVLRFEGVDILAAAREVAQVEHYQPQLTIILAVKRHHTRFFKKDRADRWVNISQGTVVDEGVTHPRDYDFFLCSQAPMKGTSRATHYHVLLDQIKLERQDLYKLIYYLCHTYQRCTKSVSLVTPIYYSHLAAFRAKLYMEYFILESRPRPLNLSTCDLNAHRDLRDRLWFL